MKIGVLGGGQLGKMLAESVADLSHSFVFFDTKSDACAAPHGSLIVGELDDKSLIEQFCSQVDVVTYESENTPLETVKFIQQHVPVYPPIAALQTTQDRYLEKILAQDLGISVAEFQIVNNDSELHAATSTIGFPCILKTTRMGYDGKGQVFLSSEKDEEKAMQLCSKQQCILEKCIYFNMECSLVSTRAQDGSIQHYPLAHNVHKEGILIESHAPANLPQEVQRQAEKISEKMLLHFEYVGTMAIEFFVMENGDLLLNEIAPRVHNSGHWTIEGVKTSQFRNHVFALTSTPLGSIELTSESVMLNIIGIHPNFDDVKDMEGVHVHLYGKSERPMRKLGHVTISHPDKEYREQCVETVRQCITKAHQ